MAGALEYEVEAVAHSVPKQCAAKKRSGKPYPVKYLVKWLGYPPENNTWQSEADLKNSPDVVTDYWAYPGRSRA